MNLLSTGVAQTELAKLRDPRNFEARLERLDSLSDSTRAFGFALVGRDARGEFFENPSEAESAIQAAMGYLGWCVELDRRNILEKIFPTLTQQISFAWWLLNSMPYNRDRSRTGFRTELTGWNHWQGKSLLDDLIEALGEFPDDVLSVEWLASWCIHLFPREKLYRVGYLFAAAIDVDRTKGPAVFDTLRACIRGEHPIGRNGPHAICGLLLPRSTEGWKLLEATLNENERRIELRDLLFENMDLARPNIFPRFLEAVSRLEFLRDPSCHREFCNWFQIQWGKVSFERASEILVRLIRMCDDVAFRKCCVDSGSAEELYFALWCMARRDVCEASSIAANMKDDSSVGRRFVAAKFLAQAGHPPADIRLLDFIEDADVRVASVAAEHRGEYWGLADLKALDDQFERIERTFTRLPEKSAALESLVLPWGSQPEPRQQAAHALLLSLGERLASRLLPYLDFMGPYERSAAIERINSERESAGPSDLID